MNFFPGIVHVSLNIGMYQGILKEEVSLYVDLLFDWFG
jgi:hypothetical protein